MVSVTVVTVVVFETFGFSTYMIMSSANGGNLTSPFLVLMHLISSLFIYFFSKSSGSDFQCYVE